jgi:hypothetical protein
LTLRLLQLLEREPLAAFAELELAREENDLETCRSLGLLDLQESPGALMFSMAGSTYIARQDGEKLIGIEIDDEDAEVVEVDLSEIRRWRVDLLRLTDQIRRVNNFRGSPARISDRLWFVGEDSFRSVLLGLFKDEELLATEALSLRQRFPTGRSRFAVVCPSLRLNPTVERRLQDNGIEIARFNDREPFRVVLPPSTGGPVTSWHTEDYRSVFYGGEWRPLTTNQALVVELLDRVGAPMSEAAILDRLEIGSSRLYQVFRGSWAWNTLLMPAGGKGMRRLNSPEIHP